MKILVFDNYDSFTYNLVHYIKELCDHQVDVFRNDEISLDEIQQYDKILLSPGPGMPDDAVNLKALILRYAPTKSIFGVCLGMQAMAESYGGKLLNQDLVFHGVATLMDVKVQGEPLFKDIPLQFEGGRYHSWIADKESLPDCFTITAEDDEGNIMAMTHNEYDMRGVQFHPESVLTPHGKQMIKNWLELKKNVYLA